MMRYLTILLSLLWAVSCSSGNGIRNGLSIVEKGFGTAQEQMSRQLATLGDGHSGFPRSLKDGELYCTSMTDWTEGFFPGCLWYLYGHTGNREWKDAASVWTGCLEPMKKYTGDHDVGLLTMSSFGNAFRLTGEQRYAGVLIEAAGSLSGRYSGTTGCIRSWNYKKSWSGEEWFFPVTISSLANLELLYFASEATGNPEYARIADSHALMTARNHLREDGSCCQVVDYDGNTGKVLAKGSNTGFSDSSVWARGQAWAIYGFTMAYRESGRKEFLAAAEKAASYWLSSPALPSDGIPYWDFCAGLEGYVPHWNYDPLKYPEVPRDASAAAIAASAFLELSGFSRDGDRYFKAGEHILETLSSPEYLAGPGENGGFILKHSVGDMTRDEDVDAPLVYADYYYLEALTRYELLKQKS